MNVSVRRATQQDAGGVAALAGQLGYPVPAEAIAERLAGLPDRRTVLVATSNDAIVGWIGVSVDATLTEGFEAHVEGCVVDASVRSGGVGVMLLEAAERWARERGAGELVVRSNVVRERAHDFYERNGYAVAKSQLVFRKALR